MSYKEKAASGDYRGGRVTPDSDAPKIWRAPCFATGCPMPGSIFPGAGQGGTGDQTGTCAWHYGVKPHDIPRVTQVLVDWQCVSHEVTEARRAICGDLATNPTALKAAFDTAWERLEPQVGEWAEQLRPSTIKWTRNRPQPVDSGIPESYADWAKRLNEFLGARVQEVLNVRSMQRRAA